MSMINASSDISSNRRCIVAGSKFLIARFTGPRSTRPAPLVMAESFAREHGEYENAQFIVADGLSTLVNTSKSNL